VKQKKIIVFLAVIVFLVQAACAVGGYTLGTEAPPPNGDVGDQVATGIALTQAAQQVVQPPADTPVPPVVQPPADTPVPPVVLPTNTQEVPIAASVQGTVNYGANCRSGPGANFPLVVVYDQGALVNVIGTNQATDKTTWWMVSSEGKADCWLFDEAVTITGDKSSVAKVASPPTPTPVPPPFWGGTWTHWMRGGFDGAADSSGKITFVQTGNYLTATFDMYGFTFKLTGTVSEDGMTMNGNLSRPLDGANWIVVMKRNPSNLNQFRGSWAWTVNTQFDGDWCGAINSAGKPSPCKTH